LTFDAVDFQYTDLDLFEVTVGETIRFDMTNSGTEEHETAPFDVGDEGRLHRRETSGAAGRVHKSAFSFG